MKEREFIAKEWRDDNGILHRREVGQELVRCKECKHWHDHITTFWCSRGAELRPQESGWIKRNADDFCSYGEREGE